MNVDFFGHSLSDLEITIEIFTDVRKNARCFDSGTTAQEKRLKTMKFSDFRVHRKEIDAGF